MTFEHPWAILLLILPAAWVAWRWRGARGRGGLLLKAGSFAAILLALAGPNLSVTESRVAAVVLADTSASLSPNDLVRASEIVERLWRARGRNSVRVIPFAGEVRNPEEEEWNSGWRLRATSGVAGRSTNVEAAISHALAVLPGDRLPRIVLISDGHENRGSALRTAWRARELGVPVDTYLLEGRPEPDLRLLSASFPTLAFTGEKFPIELVVRAPEAAPAEVRIAAEGKDLGASPVALEAGLNQFTVSASLDTPGAFDIIGSLRTAAHGEVRFAQAVTVRQPNVLLVTQDPSGTETDLTGVLAAARFSVDIGGQLPAGSLAQYEVVILNNQDLESIAAPDKARLEQFVQAGGGLLVIAGERNIYREEDAKDIDPLQRSLPAVLAPPRTPESTCVVLIVDKSSSMEGKKMELARLSAVGVVENLRPRDRVGVLIFDNSFQWAVPIRPALDKTLIKRLISGITPDGGTQIAPALTEAYRRILPVEANYKHIVLLTDGISEEGDSIALAEQAANNKVTISTVGLGQDVNRNYLQKVADFARGKAYFLQDPSGLAQILLQDVMEHTGQTAVEKEVRPVVETDAGIFENVSLETAPPLLGYVRFEAKTGADVVLRIPPRDPLLSVWQYGLGRAAVFASDAKNRWAQDWVSWDGFDPFWTNLARFLLPQSAAANARLTHDTANGELVVDYRLAPGAAPVLAPPEIFLFGPEGMRLPVPIQRLAGGAFQGRVAIGSAKGLFRVMPLDESLPFPETGIYLQEEDLSEHGHDERLLQQLAELTGGAFQPEPEEVFRPAGRTIQIQVAAWPWLLALAILLGLAELALRKLRSSAPR